MRCNTQIFNVDGFGINRRTYQVNTSLEMVQSIAIGPDSEFDACRILGAGETVIVSRERPYIGVISGRDIQVQPLHPTQTDVSPFAVDPGPVGRLSLQLFSYPIPPQETKRGPIHKLKALNDLAADTTFLKTIISGRDEIFISAEHVSGDDVDVYIRGYTYNDPSSSLGANSDAIQFELMPSDLVTTGQVYRTMSAGDKFIAAIAIKGIDWVEVFVNHTLGTPDLSFRLSAYDR